MGSLKSFDNVKKYIETVCEKSVRETAETAMYMLRQCIDEQYYKDPGFYPNVYERTCQFLNSAAYRMTTGDSANVYVDADNMHYKNNFSPSQIIEWASKSMHGAEYYQTDTTSFWDKFIEWCNNDMLNVLKNNLQKQGLKIK